MFMTLHMRKRRVSEQIYSIIYEKEKRMNSIFGEIERTPQTPLYRSELQILSHMNIEKCLIIIKV